MLWVQGPPLITVSSPWAARLRRHVRSRPWLLFELDDYNYIHVLPPGTEPGGRVGVGNPNSDESYIYLIGTGTAKAIRRVSGFDLQL